MSDEASRMMTARNEGRNDGLRKMLESFCELGIPEEIARSKVLEKFDFPQDEIESMMKEYWK